MLFQGFIHFNCFFCAYNLFKIKIYLIIVYNSVKLILVNYSQETVYVGSGEMEEGGGFLH